MSTFVDFSTKKKLKNTACNVKLCRLVTVRHVRWVCGSDVPSSEVDRCSRTWQSFAGSRDGTDWHRRSGVSGKLSDHRTSVPTWSGWPRPRRREQTSTEPQSSRLVAVRRWPIGRRNWHETMPTTCRLSRRPAYSTPEQRWPIGGQNKHETTPMAGNQM